jgi:hypothetical protein
MTELEHTQKALKLLEILERNAYEGIDNIPYLMFVLQAWYDDGYKDAIYKTRKKAKKDPK